MNWLDNIQIEDFMEFIRSHYHLYRFINVKNHPKYGTYYTFSGKENVSNAYFSKNLLGQYGCVNGVLGKNDVFENIYETIEDVPANITNLNDVDKTRYLEWLKFVFRCNKEVVNENGQTYKDCLVEKLLENKHSLKRDDAREKIDELIEEITQVMQDDFMQR